MLCKLVFLISPIIFWIIYMQLHRVPSYFVSVIYTIVAIYYAFLNKDKIKKECFKIGQDYFVKGHLIVFCLIILVSTFPIGGYMAVPLIMPHSTEKADAVLVLASGATPTEDPNLATYQRVIHGAKLVKDGQAKHLYISTGYNKYYGFLEYEAVKKLTSMLDIPQDKITIFKSDEIVTTATEAQYAKKFFDSVGINKILLTTSNAHIYRSYRTFKKIGFEVLAAPSHTKESTVYADDNYSMFRAAMHEWIGLVWYILMGRI